MAAKKIDYPTAFNENYTDVDIEHVKQIIDWLNGSQARTKRWLAKCVGKSDAYISTLLTGVHAVKADDLIAKIIPVLEDSATEHQQGEYVETSIWTVVNHACRMARSEGGFSIIAGAPGVGKTTGLEHYAELHPNTLYLRGSEVINSTAVIDLLLDALGAKIAKQQRKSAKVAAIVDQLKDSGRLIILDEADKCQKDTPDPLRTISDATGCGVVLSGNVNLRNLVAMGDNRFDLIESRVVFWPEIITKISPQDVSLLMRPYISDDMISRYESYDDIVKYAHELVKGSARKLIKSLLKQVIMLDKHQREHSSNYAGVSRQMMAKIAKSYMGIAHPPAIGRKGSAV